MSYYFLQCFAIWCTYSFSAFSRDTSSISSNTLPLPIYSGLPILFENTFYPAFLLYYSNCWFMRFSARRLILIESTSFVNSLTASSWSYSAVTSLSFSSCAILISSALCCYLCCYSISIFLVRREFCCWSWALLLKHSTIPSL